PLAVFCPSCSLKASFLLSAQSPLPTVSRLSMLPGSLPIGPRLPKSRSSLHAPQRSALRSFPPPIRPPKSTKNALSISMRAQPRSGFALWTVLFPSFLLLISKYLVLQSARIFLCTSRDFARAASARAFGKQRDRGQQRVAINSGSPALPFDPFRLCGFVARDLILPLALDVRDKSAVEAAVASLPADFAETSILVNNARLSLNLAPAHMVPIDTISMMPVCQAFAPLAIHRGKSK